METGEGVQLFQRTCNILYSALSLEIIDSNRQAYYLTDLQLPFQY